MSLFLALPRGGISSSTSSSTGGSGSTTKKALQENTNNLWQKYSTATSRRKWQVLCAAGELLHWFLWFETFWNDSYGMEYCFFSLISFLWGLVMLLLLVLSWSEFQDYTQKIDMVTLIKLIKLKCWHKWSNILTSIWPRRSIIFSNHFLVPSVSTGNDHAPLSSH